MVRTCNRKPPQDALLADCRDPDMIAVRLTNPARLTRERGSDRTQCSFEKTNPISRGALLRKELRLRMDSTVTDAVGGK
jgi:hypothetical protein